MKRCVPLAAALAAVVLVVGCSDDASPPTEPDTSGELRHDITADPALGGLFFFAPPVGAPEDRAAAFDPTQLPVVVFEVCPDGALSDDGDPLTATCAEPLGRWDSEGGPGGREIFLEGDDWYQVDVSFAALDLGPDDLDPTYWGRVIIGDPEGDAGTDFEVYGAFDFELVRNRGRAGPPGGGPPPGPPGQRGPPPGAGPGGGNADDAPRQVVWRQTLPVKWFLGEGAAAQAVCETADCTARVIEADEGGELCFPEEECDDAEAVAGTRIDEDVLEEDVVVTIEAIDLESEANPLGIPNPQIGRAVRITATPPFGDLESFDTNDNGVSDLVVQGCFEVPAGVDPDNFAIFRGTDVGAEQLPVNPQENAVFSIENCPTQPGEVALGDGLLDRARLALRDRVLRPVATLVGPRPLRAGDKSFTADTRGFSAFVPALALDLLSNEVPPASIAPGAQVPISVCVEGLHEGSEEEPAPEGGVDVSFELVTEDGGVVEEDVVTAQLEDAADADCDTPPNEDEEVAVARTLWTLPEDPGSYTARGFLDGDYVESVQQNGTYDLEDVEIEVSFQTTVETPDGEVLFAVQGADLSEIDPVTGDVTLIGNTGGTSLAGLAVRPSDDALFGVGNDVVNSTGVVDIDRIDPCTAARTSIVDDHAGLTSTVQSLAFHSTTGVVYIGGNTFLAEFEEGTVSEIGFLEDENGIRYSAYGMDFGPDGTLYAAQTDLLEIDETTGGVTNLGPITYDDGPTLSAADDFVSALSFDDDGTAFVSVGPTGGLEPEETQDLYILDLDTGVLTFRASTDPRNLMRGMTFAPAPVCIE